MPSLKDIRCSIELGSSEKTLPEFGTTYGDGVVETFVPVTKKRRPFQIHLTSDKFIAPGIAMYVYIDGVYQCNRNRQDLKLRKSSSSRSVVDFKVRQKEERQEDGSMLAREWKFEQLQTTEKSVSDVTTSTLIDSIGSIEVLVLRCKGLRNARTAQNMNLDGTTDTWDDHYDSGSYIQSSTERSMYDDREPFIQGQFRHVQGPTPPIPGHQRRDEDASRQGSHVHSAVHRVQPHSSYSGSISPRGHRPSSMPRSGYEYGFGPLPSYDQPPRTYVSTHGAQQQNDIDPDWLGEVMAKAVKQGVEQVQNRDKALQSEISQRPAHVAGQLPKTRPPSVWSAVPQAERNSGTKHGSSEAGWISSDDNQQELRTPKERRKTHVTWGAEATDHFELLSTSSDWIAQDESPSDSWDISKASASGGTRGWDAERSTPKASRGSARNEAREVSPVNNRTREPNRSTKSRSRVRSHSRRRSRLKEPEASSDDEGWAFLEAPSGSVNSEDNSEVTIKAPQPPTQHRDSRSRTKNSTHRSTASHHRSEPRAHSGRPSHSTWETEAASVPSKHLPPSENRRATTTVNAPSVKPSSTLRSPTFANQEPTVPFIPASNWNYAAATQAKKLKDDDNIEDGQWSRRGAANDDLEGWTTVDDKKLGWDTSEQAKAVHDAWNTPLDEEKGRDTKSHASSIKGDWDTANQTKKADDVWNIPDESKTDKPPTIKSECREQHMTWEQKEDDWMRSEAEEVKLKKSKKPASIIEFNIPWDDPPNKQQSGLKPGAHKSDKSKPPRKVSRADEKPASLHQEKTRSRKVSIAEERPLSTKPSPATEIPPPPSPAPPSQRHSTKSLSKYRQLRNPSIPILNTPQPHWQFPPPPPSTPPKRYTITSASSPYIAPAEPRLVLPAGTASQKSLSHHVRGGPASVYGHEIGRPEYMDRLEDPYAVFRFKYRSVDVLKSMFGEEVTERMEREEKEGELRREKEKLRGMPREELIGRMVELEGRLKDDAKGMEMEMEKEGREGKVKGFTEKWVEEQRSVEKSGEGRKGESEKKSRAKSERKEKNKKDDVPQWGKEGGDEVAGWNQGGGNGGGFDASVW